MSRPKSTSAIIGFVIAIGAILRSVVYLQSRDWIVIRMPVLDAGYYDETARALLAGSWPGDAPYFMGPLYSYVVAFLYQLFGADVDTLRVTQMILSLGAVWLTARIARRLFGSSAAVAAALLAVAYGPWLFFDQLPLMASLATVLAVAFVELLFLLRERGRLPLAICTGALLGALTAMRGTGLLYLIPAVAALRGRLTPSRWAALVVASLVILSPFVLHNRSAESRAILTTNLGWNLFVGIGPQANGMFVYPNGWRAADDVSGQAFASDLAGRELSPDETNRFWLDAALRSLRDDPGRVLLLTAKKAWLVLQAGEIPQNESFQFFRMHTPAARVAFVAWWIVLPLAVLGLFAPTGDRRGRLVVVLAALVPLLVCVLFFVTSRYRLPAVPFVIVLASGGVAWLIDTVREGDARALAKRGAPALFGMIALLAASLLVPPVNPARALAREYEHLGLRYQEIGADRSAVEAYESAIEIDPKNGDALNNLGAVYLKLERLEEAERAFQRAARVMSGNPVPWRNLGGLLGRLGRDSEAEEAFRRALEADPDDVPTIVQLGTSLALQDDLEGAAAMFERALEVDPTHAVAREYLIGAQELIDLRQSGR